MKISEIIDSLGVIRLVQAETEDQDEKLILQKTADILSKKIVDETMKLGFAKKEK